MSTDTAAARVTALAAAARVPLDDASAARIANAVAPTVQRLTQEALTLPLEAEPATYTMIARRDADL